MDYSEWKFDGESPIFIQIYNYLRCGILSGCMKPGEPIPSIRWLALSSRFHLETIIGKNFLKKYVTCRTISLSIQVKGPIEMERRSMWKISKL